MKQVRALWGRLARTSGYVVGAGIIAAWLVSLLARASIGADMPQAPKSTLTGGLPATPAPMPPLVLPVRDPFAADNFRAIADRAATSKKRRSLAAIQVPDPTSFGSVGSSGRGVLAVIVGDGSDSYALLEDGASIVIGHVGDAFGGSKIVDINERGVRLANNAMLAVDDPRKDAPALVAGGVVPLQNGQQAQPAPADGSAAALQSGSRMPISQGSRTIAPASPPQSGPAGLPTNAQPATVTLPSSNVQGVQIQPGALPGTNSYAGASGSLFPLLSTPAPK